MCTLNLRERYLTYCLLRDTQGYTDVLTMQMLQLIDVSSWSTPFLHVICNCYH